MASKATVTCIDCGTTLALPDDPVDLAFAMTAFMDSHQRLQHYNFSLGPPTTDEVESPAGYG